MNRVATGLAMIVSLGWVAFGFDEPEGLRERFLKRIQADLGRLPDFVCTQTTERFGRATAERPWQSIDTLRFEVALVGDRELYSRPGARQFQNRPLSEMIGRGSITTGQLALLAKHVFLTSTAEYTYRGESEQDGRRAYQYDYDVPADRSSYKLRSGTAEAAVAFQGSFWIDAQTLDLVRLEVQPYDLPDNLGLVEANTSLGYSRVQIDGVDVLLPLSATLRVAATNGGENLNRTRLTTCGHYRTETTIRFDGDSSAATTDAPPSGGRRAEAEKRESVPPGALLEFTLDAALDPAKAVVGEAITATLSRPVRVGEMVVIPQGAVARGRLVRLDKQSMPFAYYEVGLEFEALEVDGRRLPLEATMEDAGPASGLLKQQKRLDPTFERKRAARLDILVREKQRGQGILSWDARKGSLPAGLKMKWRASRDPSRD